MISIYILEKYVPVAILEICARQGGTCSHKDLVTLGQSEICTDVPKFVHPYTFQKDKTPTVSKFFTPSPNTVKRMRIASSSDEDTDGQSDIDEGETSQQLTPPKKTRRGNADTPTIANGFIPHGICSTIKSMIEQLNTVYSQLPAERTSGDLSNAYHVKLLKESSLWKTADVPVVFPFQRFRQYSQTKFPTDVIEISKDRHTWTCKLCPGMKRTTTIKSKFHRQNCLNHFRSAGHCQIVGALDNTGDAVAAAVEQQKQHIYSDQLPVAVIDDAIISVARKALPITAVVVTLLEKIVHVRRLCI